MREFQMDDLDLTARFFIPELLMALDLEFLNSNPDMTEYVAMLEGWDYHLSRDSIAATIYQVWLLKLVQNCIISSLPLSVGSYIAFEDRWIQLLEDYLVGSTQLDWLMEDSHSEIDGRMTEALLDTITELQLTYGFDTSLWEWGRVNKAIFPHPSGVANLIGAGSHTWGG